ncbi:hypothetical protein QN386_03935 [Pseudomonas sp. CCI3.2]|uniref:hypothetical protein n=1 Tax=unclassified Pseudomonas TaxID=196821 RepID=UPI002AC8F1FF|nr:MULTISPECIES: hypothetical protein [unclassified Pseudomonas]MEB0079092.1 hypothetical protein [Pseudomonas sp. MH10out]MEB0092101.1 hypothetical protein [Pseudomonas sp. CCI4.2]MEB0100474.1 hypothetical protein [Pseudomonas sp. CCI3.2]MEB0132342.1 hypothetical protein [Pseudomonas sp. CCI2.4]MEB0158705.1 hypothetical protein [Pseudomonas sp. AH2 (2023)]
MSLTAGEHTFLYIGLIGFGGIFVFLGVALYLVATKMDQMLESLKNCKTLTTRSFLIHAGLKGKLHVLGIITALMIVPHLYLRDGGASAEDLKKFPADLKRNLIILHWAGWIPILVVLGLGLIVKLGLI